MKTTEAKRPTSNGYKHEQSNGNAYEQNDVIIKTRVLADHERYG